MKNIFVRFLFLVCFNILFCMEHAPNQFKKEKEDQLSIAIKENNIPQVKNLIKKYPGLAQFNWDNKKDTFDPLAQAVDHNNKKMIKLIFEACCFFYEEIQAKGLNALFKAAKRGDTSLVRIMIRHGKKVNSIDLYNNLDSYTTPLGVALSHNHDETARLLIDAGASLARSLRAAVKKNDITLCKKLMELGADPRAEDKIGQTAFDYYYWYHYWIDPNGFKMLNVLGQTWKEWASVLLVKALYSCCARAKKDKTE